MQETITSRDNPQIKRLAHLISQKKERDATGLFVCEGARLCADVAASLVVETAFFTAEALKRYPQLEALQKSAGQSFVISDDLSRRISDTKSPQGVFAVCKKLDNSQYAVTIKNDGKYLLLASLQDPGNLGTIIRTACALGLDGMWVSDDSCDIYSPKVLRSSMAMGGAFRLPLCIAPDIPQQISLLQQSGIPVYSAALTDSATPLSRHKFARGAAVLIGNEGAGLPDELIRRCDESLIIPMAPGAESLNAATAAGIFIWEMTQS